MRRYRILFLLLALILLLPVLLVAGAAALLQMPEVQSRLLARIEAAAPVRLEGFRIVWPLDLRAARAEMRDGEGVWLTASDLTLSWSPWALLGGQLRLRQVSAETLALSRLPRSESPASPAGTPALPLLPVGVWLNDLHVGTLVLDPAVMPGGLTAQLSAQGHLLLGHLTLAAAASATGMTGEGRARLYVEGDSDRLVVVGSGGLHDLPTVLWPGGIGPHAAEWSLAGTLAPRQRQADLGELRLETDMGRLLASGRLGEAATALHLTAVLPDLSALAPEIRGGAELAADLSGPLERPRLLADLRLRRLATGQAEADALLGPEPRLRLALGLDRNFRPQLADLRLTAAAAGLRAGGRLGSALLAGAQLSFDPAAATAALPADLREKQGIALTGGGAQGLLTGPLADPLLSLQTQLEGSRAGAPLRAALLAALRHPFPAAGPAAPPPEGRLRMQLDALGQRAVAESAFAWGPVARLEELTVTSGEDRLDGRLAWDRAAGLAEGRLRGQLPDLRRWTAWSGETIGGGLRFEAVLLPEQGRQAGRLTAQAENVAAAGITLRRAAVEADLHDLAGQPHGQLSAQLTGLAQGALQLARAGLTAKGDPQRLSFALDTSGSLAGMPGGKAAPLTARAEGQAEPQAGRYTLSALRLAVGDRQAGLTAPAVLRLPAEGPRLESLTLALMAGPAPAGRLSLRGGRTGERLDGHADLGDLDLAWAAPFLPGLQPRGRLSGQVTLGGSPALPQIDWRLGGRGLSGQGLGGAGKREGQTVDGDSDGHWDGRRLVANLRAGGLGGSSHLALHGELPLVLAEGRPQPGRGDIAARLEADGDLARLAALVPGGPPGLAGRAVLAATLGGSLAQPRADGRLALRGLEAGGQRGSVDATVEGHWDGHRLVADLQASGLQDMSLGGRAELPLALEEGRPVFPPGPLTGRLEARADLGRLSALLPLGDQTLGGRLDAALTLGGTVEQPLVEGRAALSGGSYRNDETGTVLREVALTATTRDSRHLLLEAKGGDGAGGQFSGQGEADLQARNGSLDLDLHKLRLVKLDLLRAAVDGTLHLEGGPHQARLSGRLGVDDVQLDVGQALPAPVPRLAVEEVNRPGAPAAPPPPAAAAPPLTLTLALQVALQRLHVRGRGIDSEWHGDMTVEGEATAPRVLGALHLTRGSYDFVGRRLDLDNGSAITFDGTQPIDPRLDLTARGQARDVTAIIRVSGTALHPAIEFTSDPVVPRDEVLSRLLFNKEAGQLSTTQQLTLARMAAGQLVGGGGGGGFDPVGQVRDALGLDVLESGSGGKGDSVSAPGMPSIPSTGALTSTGAATNNPAAKSDSGPSVAAGKYLTDNTFVRVEQGTTGGNVTVEVDLGHGFAAQSRIDETKGGGLGLSWHADY